MKTLANFSILTTQLAKFTAIQREIAMLRAKEPALINAKRDIMENGDLEDMEQVTRATNIGMIVSMLPRKLARLQEAEAASRLELLDTCMAPRADLERQIHELRDGLKEKLVPQIKSALRKFLSDSDLVESMAEEIFDGNTLGLAVNRLVARVQDQLQNAEFPPAVIPVLFAEAVALESRIDKAL